MNIKKCHSQDSHRAKSRCIVISIILLSLFFLIPIFSQEFSESKQTKYPHIKELLAARLTDLAQREIDKVALDAPNDPTLNYYQTEVWYNKGEQEYNTGNYKKALEYYDKASQFWSSNPLLSERIQKVKEKIKNPVNQNNGSTLPDNSTTNNTSNLLYEKGEITHSKFGLGLGGSNINIIILDRELQETLRLQVKGVLDENIPNNLVSIPRAYLLFFSILGLCLVVANIISLHILMIKK